MSIMDTDIRNYVSRYVVPFYYQYENDGFKRLRNHFVSEDIDDQALGLLKGGRWIQAGFWENYKSDKAKHSEMDVYSYLPSVFRDEKNTDGKAGSNLGLSFVYKTDGKLLELGYRYKEKRVAFNFTELGILLLRNGIGFIWYETEFKGNISIDEYVRFQNDFKELARTHGTKFVKKIGYDKEKGKNLDQKM